MDLRKKTNPFVENAKAIEFRRKAAMRQQQMTSGKTAAQRFKEKYGRKGAIASSLAGSYGK
tara:strand:+ start:51 stop:233 length:183 start_codon:yes stop_codon:yes gene_type:complete